MFEKELCGLHTLKEREGTEQSKPPLNVTRRRKMRDGVLQWHLETFDDESLK